MQGRWALSLGLVLPGDIHLPSMTGCWKVPLPHQALLYKRSRAEVMLPVLLPHLTLRALPEPTIPTGRATAARVWDIESPSQPRLLLLPHNCGVGRDQAALACSGMSAGEKGDRVPFSVSVPALPLQTKAHRLPGWCCQQILGHLGYCTEGAAGFGGIWLHECCSAVTVQEPSVAGTQCCGQSCYQGLLDVSQAMVALWLSPCRAIPQPLPAYDVCGLPACRGSWQCPWIHYHGALATPPGAPVPCHGCWWPPAQGRFWCLVSEAVYQQPAFLMSRGLTSPSVGSQGTVSQCQVPQGNGGVTAPQHPMTESLMMLPLVPLSHGTATARLRAAPAASARPGVGQLVLGYAGVPALRPAWS